MPPKEPTPGSYRVQIQNGKQYEELGPLSVEELSLLVEKGMLWPHSLYFDENQNSWMAISHLSQLCQTLFKNNEPSEKVFDVLFTHPDKPALKEPKSLTISNIKDFYKEGKINQNTVIFDKENNTWVPLRTHKELSEIILENKEKIKAITPNIAFKFAQSELLSKTNISDIHNTLITPTHNESKKTLTTPDTQPVTIKLKELDQNPAVQNAFFKPAPSSTSQPTVLQSVHLHKNSNIEACIHNKNMPDLMGVLGEYARYFMGLSGICLCLILYSLHKEEIVSLQQVIYNRFFLESIIKYPFIVILGINCILWTHILLPQKIPNSLITRSLIGFFIGTALSYFYVFSKDLTLNTQIACSVLFIGSCSIITLRPQSFSFAFCKIITLLTLGYLGYIYWALHYYFYLITLTISCLCLYFGIFKAHIHTPHPKHTGLLITSFFLFGQLCISQLTF